MTIKKKKRRTHIERVQENLLDTLAQLEASLPLPGDAISEDFERISRTTAILIKSFETLKKLEKENSDKENKKQKRSHTELIAEIEHRLDRITAAAETQALSGDSDT